VIPTSYQAWRECIEVHCRIALEHDFIAQRLRELDDPSIYSTQQLRSHYGEAHLAQLRAWFRRASVDLDAR
jgi:hypothetical protein